MAAVRLTKSDREVIQELLEKHQVKNPGCSLGQRKCRFEYSDDCIGMGDKSEFLKGNNKCMSCVSVQQKKYYDTVTLVKRRAAALLRKLKKKRSVSFKKGTKKE